VRLVSVCVVFRAWGWKFFVFDAILYEVIGF